MEAPACPVSDAMAGAFLQHSQIVGSFGVILRRLSFPGEFLIWLAQGGESQNPQLRAIVGAGNENA
jgi:hypothetical protein